MGKRLKPPGEVFNDWTPEQQEAYNSQLDPLYQDREKSIARLNDLGDDGAPNSSTMWYNEDGNSDNSIQRQALLALDSEDHPNPASNDGVAGTRLANLYLANSSGGSYDRSIAQKQASIRFERSNLKETNAKIAEIEVEASPYSSVNHEEIKQQYVEALKAEIEKDRQLYDEANKKLQAMQADFKEHKIKYALFDNNHHYNLMQAQLKHMQSILERIKFNTTNLDNTAPPPPPPPPPPPTPPAPAPSVPIVQRFVTGGAKLQCTFGAVCTLNVIRPMTLLENAPMANIMDFKPFVNIVPTGTCSAPTNPAVVAAMGSPVPCTPLVTAPWVVGKPDVLVENQPALLSTDKCLCTYGGVISIMP